MSEPTRRDFLRWASLIGGVFGFSAAIFGKITARPSIATETVGESAIASPLPPRQSFEFETVTLDPSGFIIDRARHRAEYYVEEIGGLEMIAIPSGTFLMGSPEGEKSDYTGSDRPQRLVTVSSFYLSKYPITQRQWKVVANLPRVNLALNPDPSHFKGEDLPVESVSWHEAIEFCDRLSKATGRAYQLPSEARWEYACRAGTTSPFYFGVTLTSQFANYYALKDPYAVERESEYRAKTVPVGSFPPNAFGLFDLHGSLYEWCADPWHRNYKNAPTDGSIWLADPNSTGNRYRVLRGGGWGSTVRECRSASRGQFGPNNRYSVIGFRVAMV
jgi:formylglycine-generating enzyme required for sulfatase activity